jgi:hypothetical protein
MRCEANWEWLHLLDGFMKQFRILEEGSVYQVAKLTELIGVRIWIKEKHHEEEGYETNSKGNVVEFHSREAAELYVQDQLDQDMPNPWRVSRTF